MSKEAMTDEKGRPLTFWGGKAEQPAPAQQCMEHGECFGGECLYPATHPAQCKPLTDEQHSLAYWQHEINKARDEAYLQGFAAGKKEAKCSAG